MLTADNSIVFDWSVCMWAGQFSKKRNPACACGQGEFAKSWSSIYCKLAAVGRTLCAIARSRYRSPYWAGSKHCWLSTDARVVLLLVGSVGVLLWIRKHAASEREESRDRTVERVGVLKGGVDYGTKGAGKWQQRTEYWWKEQRMEVELDRDGSQRRHGRRPQIGEAEVGGKYLFRWVSVCSRRSYTNKLPRLSVQIS